MERAKGVEPLPEAWRATILPLNYTRTHCFYRSLNSFSNGPFGLFSWPFSGSGTGTLWGVQTRNCLGCLAEDGPFISMAAVTKALPASLAMSSGLRAFPVEAGCQSVRTHELWFRGLDPT
jgi:hypothetical protein